MNIEIIYNITQINYMQQVTPNIDWVALIISVLALVTAIIELYVAFKSSK